jgi:hypothetical protein
MGGLDRRLDRLEQVVNLPRRDGTLADLILSTRGDHDEQERFTWPWLPDLLEKL